MRLSDDEIKAAGELIVRALSSRGGGIHYPQALEALDCSVDLICDLISSAGHIAVAVERIADSLDAIRSGEATICTRQS